MKLHQRARQDAAIPTASMADIAFLLIIFFMVTITFEVDKTQVTLPASALRYEIPKKAAYISVSEEGTIRVSSGEEISTVIPGPEDVLSFAASTVASNPQKVFVVKADKDTRYQIIDRVIDSLKQAKVETMYLLSQAETIDGAAPAGN
ncbi:MAG: biopolymer transporter ExbD [Acidobacteriota bacterium]